MNIVVTGSAGMIGSVLCEALLRAGHEVRGVDREPNRWSMDVESVTIRLDLLGEHAIAGFAPADVVVHLAANARVHELVLDPRRALENMETTFQALEYARACRAHFIFASSREVYGNQALDRYREDDVNLASIESPYAASKLAGEALVRSYGRVYAMPWTIVRFSNVYGRNDLSERFIPRAFASALAGEPLPIYGREKRLDFTYIDDAIAGVLRMLERRDKAAGETFNISGGRAHTLVEAAELVGRAVGRPLALEMSDPRPGEVVRYEADLGAARASLGYEPRVTLEEGIALAAPWYEERFAAEQDTRRQPAIARAAPASSAAPRETGR